MLEKDIQKERTDKTNQKQIIRFELRSEFAREIWRDSMAYTVSVLVVDVLYISYL